MKKRTAIACLTTSLLLAPLQSHAETNKPVSATQQAYSYKNDWVSEGNQWYFYENNQKQTGWKQVRGRWFYLDNQGVMKTGWQQINNKWYYLDNEGAMKTGWFNDGRDWYMLNAEGDMKTGWYHNGSNWFYLNPDGRMAKDWVKVNNTWYLMDNEGAMKTGWQNKNWQWYYMDSSGAMKTGWNNIDGQRYYFEDDGKWVESNEADLLKTVGNNNQLILVTTNDYGTNRAKIKTFDKRNNKWYQVSSEDGYLGKQGFAHEMSEYVNASPRGKYTIGTAFGRYDNPGTKLPYRKITSNDVWVDDSNSQYYNTWQQKPVNGRWNSAENMNVSAYDYGFAINYNTERTPHKGSAIFFHVSDSWTAGCTGVSKQNVVNTLKWLDPSKNPVIVQTPESELGYY